MKKHHLIGLGIGAFLAAAALSADYAIRSKQAQEISVSRIGMDIKEAGTLLDLVPLPTNCEQLKLIIKRAKPGRDYERLWLTKPSVDLERIDKKYQLEPGDEVFLLNDNLAALDCSNLYCNKNDWFHGDVALENLPDFNPSSHGYHPPFRLKEIDVDSATHFSAGSENKQCYNDDFFFYMRKGMTLEDLLDPEWPSEHDRYRLQREVIGWSTAGSGSYRFKYGSGDGDDDYSFDYDPKTGAAYFFVFTTL